jgi:hypothetical protein
MNRTLRVFLSILFVAGWLAGAAGGQDLPVVQLSNGALPLAQLLVGDDLWVELSQGTPSLNYRLNLSGPGGVPLASELVLTDGAGRVPPTLLWARSGVVGCDPCIAADPTLFLFENFEQAELALAGLILQLEVALMDGTPVAFAAIPVLAPARPILYFSDQDGCPRQVFAAGEPVYLSQLHGSPDDREGRLFLVGASPAWAIGDPLAEVRAAPQSLAPAGGGKLATWPVAGLVSLPAGDYQGIVRWSAVGDLVFLDSDDLIADRVACGPGHGGLTITVEICTHCPTTG